MNRLLICLACLAPTVALAEPNWRVAARAGAQFQEDDGFDFVAEYPSASASEILFERRVMGPYWVGFTFAGANKTGDVFQAFDTTWDLMSFKLTAMARWRLLQPLAVFGRLGPTLNRTALELRPRGNGRTFESIAWAVGVHAGAGVEWTPIIVPGDDGEISTAIGFTLEGSYQRIVPADVTIGDAALGSLDPSGPGVALGLSVEW